MGILPGSGFLSSSGGKGDAPPPKTGGGFLDGILGIGGKTPAEKSPGKHPGAHRETTKGQKPDNSTRGRTEKYKKKGGQGGDPDAASEYDRNPWFKGMKTAADMIFTTKHPRALNPNELTIHNGDVVMRQSQAKGAGYLIVPDPDDKSGRGTEHFHVLPEWLK